MSLTIVASHANGTLTGHRERVLHAGRELERSDTFTYKANDGTLDSNSPPSE